MHGTFPFASARLSGLCLKIFRLNDFVVLMLGGLGREVGDETTLLCAPFRSAFPSKKDGSGYFAPTFPVNRSPCSLLLLNFGLRFSRRRFSFVQFSSR